MKGRGNVKRHVPFVGRDAASRAIPPNTTVLISPPPEPIDVPSLVSGRPPHPEWLEDGYVGEHGPNVADANHRADQSTNDPEAERAAIAEAERAKYGPGGVRLLAHLITMNALIEYAHSPAKKDDEEQKPLPTEPEPDAK